MQPFSPFRPATRAVVAAAGIRIPLAPWVDSAGGALAISPLGAFPVYVAWGGDDVACTHLTGHWCQAGQTTVWGVPGNATHLFLVADPGAAVADVQVSQGRGL